MDFLGNLNFVNPVDAHGPTRAGHQHSVVVVMKFS